MPANISETGGERDAREDAFSMETKMAGRSGEETPFFFSIFLCFLSDKQANHKN